VLVRGSSEPRFFVHLLVNFLHRSDRERRAMYFGDLDSAGLAETVGIAALEPAMQDPSFRKRFHDYSAVVGADRQRPINALSVSEATGIPRETVRRKLKMLVKKGVLMEKDGGYIYKPGFAQKPENLVVLERGIRDALQFMNDCLKFGLVTWSATPGQAPAESD
jgi:predicted transcriptional regulator